MTYSVVRDPCDGSNDDFWGPGRGDALAAGNGFTANRSCVG